MDKITYILHGDYTKDLAILLFKLYTANTSRSACEAFKEEKAYGTQQLLNDSLDKTLQKIDNGVVFNEEETALLLAEAYGSHNLLGCATNNGSRWRDDSYTKIQEKASKIIKILEADKYRYIELPIINIAVEYQGDYSTWFENFKAIINNDVKYAISYIETTPYFISNCRDFIKTALFTHFTSCDDKPSLNILANLVKIQDSLSSISENIKLWMGMSAKQ